MLTSGHLCRRSHEKPWRTEGAKGHNNIEGAHQKGLNRKDTGTSGPTQSPSPKHDRRKVQVESHDRRKVQVVTKATMSGRGEKVFVDKEQLLILGTNIWNQILDTQATSSCPVTQSPAFRWAVPHFFFQWVGLCVARTQDWTLRHPSSSDWGCRLCIIPLPTNSNTSGLVYLLAGAGYFFLPILVSFLFMHAPSDVQIYFLV